jgi:hypothetical protein
LLATPALGWLGRLPVGRAVVIFAGAVLLGTILTLAMGQDPGFLLGLFLILGSVAAAVAVRSGAVHTFIPLPALAYLVAAILTGMVHDSGSPNSSRQFVLNFLTWIGGSFVAVTASTILVVLIALTRWLLAGRLVSGQLPASGRAAAERVVARPAARNLRGNRDPRDGSEPRDEHAPRGSRDQRGGRDSRGTPSSRRNQGRPGDRGRRDEGTWPSQAFQGDRKRRDEDTWAGQDSQDDRGRRDEGTWPSPSMRDDRGRYDDDDPWGDRRSPSGPRDLW